MGSLVKQTQKVEKNKRYLAVGVTAVGVAAAITTTAFLGVPILAVGAYLGYDWFKFRAKHGMRF
jgi:hypothetical protein